MKANGRAISLTPAIDTWILTDIPASMAESNGIKEPVPPGNTKPGHKHRRTVESVAPAFSKSKVDRAGEILIDDTAAAGDRREAVRIWDNWRSSHAWPLQAIADILRSSAAEISKESIVSERLKRLPSVVKKLRRRKTMNLSQVQDIGGCRAVVPTLADVRALEQLYFESQIAHPLKDKDDYIAHPKTDGYRSLHLIHRFAGPPDSHKGLLVETQIRSRIQHAWSTAVECVDILHGQSLKFGGGTEEWQRFFLLMSSALAIREGSPPAQGTPIDMPSIVDELRTISEKLDPVRKLSSYKQVIKEAPDSVAGAKYLLLELRAADQVLEIKGFKEEEFEEATRQYTAVDKARSADGIEAVLVSVETLLDLPKAYPNYYLDTELFVKAFHEIMA